MVPEITGRLPAGPESRRRSLVHRMGRVAAWSYRTRPSEGCCLRKTPGSNRQGQDNVISHTGGIVGSTKQCFATERYRSGRGVDILKQFRHAATNGVISKLACCQGEGPFVVPVADSGLTQMVLGPCFC